MNAADLAILEKYNTKEAKAAGDIGRWRAYDAASDRWKAIARGKSLWVAARFKYFTIDMIRLAGVPDRREMRALGGVMNGLSGDDFGWNTSVTVKGSQVRSHGSPVYVWRSNIYQPALANRVQPSIAWDKILECAKRIDVHLEWLREVMEWI